MESDKPSPFQPGEPVRPEKFEGRTSIIEEYKNYLMQVVNGNPQHFFITGKRGMGKTSLANFISNIAKNDYSLITAHIMNDGVHTIEELIIQIIERILNSIKSEKWSKKIFDYLKDSIETVGFGGLNIKFKPSKNELKNIKDNFAFYLIDLINNFKDKDGVFIVIDDINGLSDTPDFANWYKSFADTMATSIDFVPIGIMLTGYPEKLEALYNHNPSFNRIFRHNEIGSLEKGDIKNFFIKNFNSVNIQIENSALQLMVHFSSGLPTMMQEIGDGVFWVRTSDMIDKEIALVGIIRAGEEIGIKYLKPALDTSIRSDKYLSIFDKLGDDFLNHITEDYTFRKKDFVSNLDQHEEKVFSDFLKKARDLRIIEFTGAKRSGHYKFTNNLYPLYFAIQSLKKV